MGRICPRWAGTIVLRFQPLILSNLAFGIKDRVAIDLHLAQHRFAMWPIRSFIIQRYRYPLWVLYTHPLFRGLVKVGLADGCL